MIINLRFLLVVTNLGLHIPQNSMTYSDFKAAMQISEAKLLAALNDL